MIVVAGAGLPLGKAVTQTLNEHSFNYMVLSDSSQLAPELLAGLRYWHLVPGADLTHWVEKNAQEMEFIIDCNPIDQQSASIFLSLWQLGYKHQIPVVGIGKAKADVEPIISEHSAPFFWTILLDKASSDPKNTAKAIYYLIRDRQNPGTKTVESVLRQYS
ncbi:MAG: hypothetical protein AAF944_27200 [Bacteroidota bacterium]